MCRFIYYLYTSKKCRKDRDPGITEGCREIISPDLNHHWKALYKLNGVSKAIEKERARKKPGVFDKSIINQKANLRDN